MSFGGGGGSGGGIIAHTHNSGLPNDGGDLSVPLTQISGGNLATYIVVHG
jgi:hypothetical protein